MESQLKQRLVGIAVVVSLAVIFLPMLLDGSGVVDKKTQFEQLSIAIPPPPTIEKRRIDVEAKLAEVDRRVEQMPLQPNAALDEKNKDVQQVFDIDKTEKKLGGDSWVAQLGSFKDQSKAFKLKNKVAAYKVAAVSIQKVKLETGYSYRVRLGPFLYKKQAQAAVEKLNKKEVIKAVVMKGDK